MRQMNKRGKKALSPVIATVLLIMMVLILAIIILLWSKAFIKEQILKFDKPIENVCNEVSIKTFVNPDNTYGFTNTGNVPIYSVNVKISEKGSSDTILAGPDQKGQVDIGLSTILIGVPPIVDGVTTEVRIIPILQGKNKDGAIREYNCSEQSSFVLFEK
jgi:flagellin-like protein